MIAAAISSATVIRRRLSGRSGARRSEEHTSELQSQSNLVCRLLLEKKNSLDHPILTFQKDLLLYQNHTTDDYQLKCVYCTAQDVDFAREDAFCLDLCERKHVQLPV